MAEITQFRKLENGSRTLGVRMGSVSVLLQPDGEEHQADAQRIAEQISGAADRMAQLEAEVSSKGAVIADLRRRVEASEARLGALLDGKRRFFGPVLVKPNTPGDWTGTAWALDPDKQEGARGIMFASLSALRWEHPELWPIGVMDGGILMDAWTTLPK